MTINELCDALMTGTQVKAVSAMTGRVLIVNAAKQDKREKYGSMRIFSIEPSISVMDRGSFARPIMTGYCLDSEYAAIKEARNVAE